MHASIWRYTGDTADLLARYDAMMSEIGGASAVFHACLATDDGIVIVDTCPSKEVWDGFWQSEGLTAMLAKHGLDRPEVHDHPVHAAIANGQRVDLQQSADG